MSIDLKTLQKKSLSSYRVKNQSDPLKKKLNIGSLKFIKTCINFVYNIMFIWYTYQLNCPS